MNARSVESRLLALDAAVKALVLTHPKPLEAFSKFSQIFPQIVRELNEDGSLEKAVIAKELMAECNALSVYFPKI